MDKDKIVNYEFKVDKQAQDIDRFGFDKTSTLLELLERTDKLPFHNCAIKFSDDD